MTQVEKFDWNLKEINLKIAIFLVLVVILTGEIVIFVLSLIASVFLIIGTSKVSNENIFCGRHFMSFSFSERRSLHFSLLNDFTSRRLLNYHQLSLPALAIHSFWHLHMLLVHLHSVTLSGNSRGKSKTKQSRLRAESQLRAKFLFNSDKFEVETE